MGMVDLILIIAFAVVAYFSFKAGAKFQTFEKALEGAKAWMKKNFKE